MIGRTIGHYQVTDRVGAGGMGEVYAARDTRLGRSVALKVLPDAFSRDPERLMRFEREARLLASLNHAGIATVYGVEHDGDNRVLVMELVEGEDLAKRIARGPVPPEEALPIARQLADALEAAHDQGVIHRDLKPANIVVTADGNVKVLDFGLAKALESDAPTSGLSHSPTLLNSSPTAAGVILGTAAYMSPEQARGKRVDRRADIFAFGCVCYEMLTGRQAFGGETVSDTLAAVLRAEPDWDALPAQTPAAFRKLLARCLEKNPKQRLRDIGEARIVLESVLRGDADEAESAPAAPAPQRRRAWPVWALAALLCAVTAGWVITARRAPVATQPLLRAAITIPADTPLNLTSVHPGPPALSPDGRSVAFCLDTPEGPKLAVRDLSRDDIRTLSGTEGAGYPFWSADSRQLGFFAQGKLKLVSVSGGIPVTLADADIGKGGTWNQNGTIVFAPSFATALFKIPATGGTPVAVTHLDSTRHESSHRFPRFLPDQKHFLYVVRRFGGEDAGHTLRVGSVDGEPEHDLFATQSDAVFAGGYLFFVRDGALTAQAFDPKTFSVSGDPVTIAPSVRILSGATHGVFDVSPSGVAVYQTGGAMSVSGRLALVDPSGKELSELGSDQNYSNDLRIAPDGRSLVVSIFDLVGGTPDLWLIDMSRGTKTRFTFAPGNENNPAWSPDGSRIAYSSNQDGHFGVYVKRVVGTEKEKRVVASEHDLFVAGWSPDGRFILAHEVGTNGQGRLRCFPLEGNAPDPLAGANLPSSLGGVMGLYNCALSPDGKWLAFDSAEGGREQVYAIPFGRVGRRWQITVSGGRNPHWAGAHVYYQKTRQIWRVKATSTDQGLTIGDEEKVYTGQGMDAFDVVPDESRIVILRGTRQQDGVPLSLITNWRALIAARSSAH